jgi:hypothetical protein
MAKKAVDKTYISFVQELRQEIMKSRLQAVRLVNRELLLLYYKMGLRLSEKIEKEKWGAKVLDKLSSDLQKSMPGLRGFSKSNLLNMRLFSEAYSSTDFIKALTEAVGSKEEEKVFLQSLTGKFVARATGLSELQPTKKMKSDFEKNFFVLSFTHHVHILSKLTTWQERFYYIAQCAAGTCSGASYAGL